MSDSNGNGMRRAVIVGAILFVLGAAVGGGSGFAIDWFGAGKAEPTPAPKAAERPAPAPAANPQASTQAAAAAPALPSFADMAAAARPAVANISTTQTVKPGDPEGMFGGPGGPFMGPPGGGPSPFGGPGSPFDEFFRRFLPPMPKNFKRRSLGSGFLVDGQGTIVTNNHVVEHADEVIVKLSSSDHEFKAKVMGVDPKTDLAVIKIEPKEGGEFSFLRMGDSSKLRVGDWVLAIGNPFGLEQTVTAGIVSATGRAIGQGPYDDFIQTDASINPGNSGGPLLNLQGEVVGINSAIFSQTGGNVGIGFAIPANLAGGVIDALKTKGKVVRGWLGVVIQDVTEDLAQSFGLTEPRGALVADLTEEGPGAKGGLQRGDVIVEFDGKPVKSSHELPSLVAATAVGKEVEVEVLRGGKAKTLTVKIAEMPKDAGAPGAGPGGEGGEGTASDLGLVISPITPEIASELKVAPGSGVVVRSVKSGSRAEESGIRPGDVIQEVNRQPVKSIDDFRKAIESKKGGTQLFLVKRGTATIFLAVKPAAK